MNLTARRAVCKKEGGDSLALNIYEMVAPVGKNSRQGG